MSKNNLMAPVYENERVIFKSLINGFSNKLFKEFDLNAEKIGLQSKIDDLFNAEIVNPTENLAALHPTYRDKYNPLRSDSPSNKGQQKELNDLFDILKRAENIITIGIGGSYEGPKMFLENIEGNHKDKNLIFITGSDLSEFILKTNNLNPKNKLFIISSKSLKLLKL